MTTVSPAAAVLGLLLLAPRAAAAPAVFDHSAFDALLRRHVVQGMVDYDAFKKAPEFAAYLARLDRAAPEALPEAERLAYWINVYNAFTIALINKHGERDSIRNINKTLFWCDRQEGPSHRRIAIIPRHRRGWPRTGHGVDDAATGRSRPGSGRATRPRRRRCSITTSERSTPSSAVTLVLRNVW